MSIRGLQLLSGTEVSMSILEPCLAKKGVVIHLSEWYSMFCTPSEILLHHLLMILLSTQMSLISI